ncbi:PAS domain-containing protein, partial [Phenylobacterium sp.]|uniref:PAS domain-containing protein n=1 Tax=Phenylobacterium sp. TaxID=1871053 RepID=UPI002F955692
MSEPLIDLFGFCPQGPTARLMLDGEWESSSLGAPATWPPLLKAYLRLLVEAQQPMFIAWGSDLTFIYNDEYAPILGIKHPNAFGRPFSQVWADIWEQISPLVENTMAGQASWHEDLLIPMERKGYREDAWFSFSYTPIRDDAGGVQGMICMASETTQKVLAQQRTMEDRQRLRDMFEQAPTFMAMLAGPEHRIELANPGYMTLVGHRRVLGRTVAEALPDAVVQGYLTLLDGVYSSGNAYSATGAKYAVQAEPDGPVNERYVDFVYQPLKDVEGRVTGIFVLGADVTDRTLSELAVRASQEQLQLMVLELNHRVKNNLATV